VSASELKIGRLLSLRGAVAIASAAFAMVAATGATESALFVHPSLLKYLLTILAPTLVFVASLSEHPLRVIVVPAIIITPMASANAGLGGARLGALTPFLFAGVLLAPFADVRQGSRAGLSASALLAFPLLLLPLAEGSHGEPFAVTLVLMIAVAYVVSVAAREPGGMAACMTALTISATIQAAIAIWESRTGHIINFYGEAGTHSFASSQYVFNYGSTRRPDGTFTDPISMGNFLAIALPCTLVLGVYAQGRARKASLVASAMLIATALTLSLSRTSWVGGVVGCALAVFLLPKELRASATKVVAAGVVGIVIIASLAAGPTVVARLVSIGSPTATSGVSKTQKDVAEGDQKRLEFWHIAVIDAFGEHPVAGIGVEDMGEFIRNRVQTAGGGIVEGYAIFVHAHSTYFQLLGEAGLFGLALLLIFIRGLLRDAFGAIRGSPIFGPGLAGAAVALLICWATDWVIHNEPVAAGVGVVLGLVAAGGRLSSELANI
jgi:O-antigen ligase